MQMQKQARKLANKSKPGNPVRTQVVPAIKFNPVVPEGIEIMSASLRPDGNVVVTSQPRQMLCK